MVGKEAGEPGSDAWEVLCPVQLKDEPRSLLFSASIEQLLREREVHDHDVLVQLARALRFGTSDVEAHDVRGAVGRRREHVETRSARAVNCRESNLYLIRVA